MTSQEITLHWNIMAKPIKVRIDVTAIDETALFRAPSGKVYLDLVAWPIKGESRYGETHSVKQQFPKDDPRNRECPFLGNLILPDSEPPDYSEAVPPREDRQGYETTKQAATPAYKRDEEDLDVPF